MILEEIKSESNSLQEKYIDNLITNQSPVSIYLKNSIRLKGHIVDHDDDSIFLSHDGIQKIFKQKISTVSPEMVFSSWSEPISA